MFAFRLVLGWGLLLLAITPALAHSGEGSGLPLRPFHDEVIASFADVWREPSEGVAAEATTPVADSVTLLPILTATPAVPLNRLLSPADTIRAAQTGLFEWFVKMLGVVGLVGLVGFYWIYRVRPALDDRHTTSRLRLSSALALPRRPGLFLIDVEDQSVLVAMDGGGIRQVVPLGLLPSMNTSGRRAAKAADKAQRVLSPTTPTKTPVSEVVAFHDIYQQQRGRGGDLRVVSPAAKSATRLQPTAHLNTVP